MIRDIFYFIQGYARYYLVKMFGFGVLRSHIGEQIMMRGMSADRKCVGDGRCKICGCHTPALFYADKECDKPCYPAMKGRKEWKRFKEERGNDEWYIKNFKFIRLKEIYE